MRTTDEMAPPTTQLHRLVIPRALLDAIRASIATPAADIDGLVTLAGRRVDDVFQVSGIATHGSSGLRFQVETTGTTSTGVRFRAWEDGQPGPELAVVSYDLEAEMYSRIDGIFETRLLAGRRVAIVGLGTFGSCVADELVRCGVDNFTLIDFDRLEAHNVVRHSCDLADLGRFKTRAVADRIRRVNPRAVVTCHEINVLEARDVVDVIVAEKDLLLVCTDNNASRFFLNERALHHGVPAIYGGAYERAFGGHVIRVIPKQTPCYECVVGGVLSRMGIAQEGARGKVAYLGASGEAEFVAEPGLGLDARFIAMIQAKMALLTLLRDTDSSLEDFPSDLVFWGNRQEWIFPSPLYAQFAEATFRENCSTCGRMD